MDKDNVDSNKALYKQVKEYIINKIKENIFSAGDKIPPERELSEDLNISRYSVRKGIQQLVKEGFLYRVQGNGTFVFEKHPLNSDEKKNHIGVIMDANQEFKSDIIKGIEKGLDEEQFRMIVVDSLDDINRETKLIHELKSEGIRGLIIMPARKQEDSSAIEILKEEQFPFVLVDRRLKDCKTNCVMSDNIDGSYKATQHLIKLGHEKIAFVRRKDDITTSVKDRMIGFKKALRNYSLTDNLDLIYSYDFNRKSEKMNSDLCNYIKKHKITGVVALSDSVALKIYKACRKRNINIPDELSLVGFDNWEPVKHLDVPLTTVAQFPDKIGFQAVKLLIEKINANDQENNNHLVEELYYPVELIKRESCRRLN